MLPGIRFNNTSLREILNSIGMTSGVNVTYDNTFQDRMYTVQLDNVTLEEALNQILAANQLFYKVVSPRSIIVVPDNVQKRGQYEEQAIRTFPISHADATELAQLINTVIRVGGGQVQPMVVANKTANTITVRATTNVMAIIERIVEQNDNPRAEVVVDVQILEVNRSRTKQFGLDLGDYSISTVFSPEAGSREARTATAGDGTASAGTTLGAAAVQRQHRLARHQHHRLLPGRAVGRGPVPRERLGIEADRQAAAARRRRAEADAQPRRGSAHPARPRSRRWRRAARRSTR